jgi:uncharacterized protein
MTPFYWSTALGGGMLIGISATLLLAFNGRTAGISGIVNGAMNRANHEIWRWWFLGGMVGGGALYEYVLAAQPTPHSSFAPWAMVIGGFLVGFGTRMANGCTSGHGVCGLGKLSGRSLVAVLTFLTTAILTIFVIRHVISG